MKIATMTVIVLACTFVLCAEDNPLSSELKAQYASSKKNITEAATRMPDGDYSF